jgi:hypothetical protein
MLNHDLFSRKCGAWRSEALKESPDYRVENLLEAAKLIENLTIQSHVRTEHSLPSGIFENSDFVYEFSTGFSETARLSRAQIALSNVHARQPVGCS